MKRRFPLQRQAAIMAFMVGMTAVVTSLVSGAHLLTIEKVMANQERQLRRALLIAAGLDAGAGLREGTEERLREGPGAGIWTVLSDDGRPQGYLVIGQAPGLWGRIRGVVGFDAEGRRLTGVEFTEHNETPGLGARIDEAEFKRQFPGKRPPFRLAGEAESEAPTDAFDAVTGATITSAAVRDLLNKSAERLQRALKGDAVP